jgi:hypothetical protein
MPNAEPHERTISPFALQMSGEARRIREVALTARHVGSSLTRDADKQCLLRHAEQLEKEADQLEAQILREIKREGASESPVPTR